MSRRAAQPSLFAEQAPVVASARSPKPEVPATLEVFVRRTQYLLDERLGQVSDEAAAVALLRRELGREVKLFACRQGWWSEKRTGPLDEWTAADGAGAVGYVAPVGRYAPAGEA